MILQPDCGVYNLIDIIFIFFIFITGFLWGKSNQLKKDSQIFQFYDIKKKGKK